MKIRLLVNLPIDPSHGAVEGLVVEAEQVPFEERTRSCAVYRFESQKTGEVIGVLSGEAEVVN